MAESLQISAALGYRTTALGRSNLGLEARALRLSLSQNRPYQNISTSLSSVTRYNDFRLAALVVYELRSRAKQGKQSSKQRIVAAGTESMAEAIQNIAQAVFKCLAKTPLRIFLLGLDKVVDKAEEKIELGIGIVKMVDTVVETVEDIVVKVEEIVEEVHEDLDEALGVTHDHDHDHGKHDNGKAHASTSTQETKESSTQEAAP